MRTGRVKWFDTKKGFGFIVDNDHEEDVFVHYRDILSEGFKNLTEGQEVEFLEVETERGLAAKEVVALT